MLKVVVPCHNPKYLGPLLKWWPVTFRDVQLRIVYLSHLDRKDLADELKQAAATQVPQGLNWLVEDISDTCYSYANDIGLFNNEAWCAYWKHQRQGYSLGFKQLIPLVYRQPVLYLDCDIVIGKDPTPLLTRTFGSDCGMSLLGDSLRDLKWCEEASEAFHCEVDPFEYGQHHFDAGVTFFKNPTPWWITCLDTYWSIPTVRFGVRNTDWFRCHDQKFLTCMAIKFGWSHIRGVDNLRVWYGRLEKFNPTPEKVRNTYFTHYCATSHKQQFIDWFMENG